MICRKTVGVLTLKRNILGQNPNGVFDILTHELSLGDGFAKACGNFSCFPPPIFLPLK
jgi:hypothetical protein